MALEESLELSLRYRRRSCRMIGNIAFSHGSSKVKYLIMDILVAINVCKMTELDFFGKIFDLTEVLCSRKDEYFVADSVFSLSSHFSPGCYCKSQFSYTKIESFKKTSKRMNQLHIYDKNCYFTLCENSGLTFHIEFDKEMIQKLNRVFEKRNHEMIFKALDKLLNDLSKEMKASKQAASLAAC
ncbi:unnamed protein product [Moneuplotes crassus]|uniref:Uncharacterized protein n=1 Tax=Euplotes crassus TaxID=5936 RepID=A0AAD1XAZ2_EUPCR|nr:unnamed protein product [Moneuplotes crassus]